MDARAADSILNLHLERAFDLDVTRLRWRPALTLRAQTGTREGQAKRHGHCRDSGNS
jgi:hypothetical protein